MRWRSSSCFAKGAKYQAPTYRAEVIRVLMVELTRIVNHYWAIGFLLNDLGAFFTPALYAIAEREKILDFFEATAGSRMMCNYMRFGGVFKDMPERIASVLNLVNDKVRDFNTMDYLTELINERIPRSIDELDTFLTAQRNSQGTYYWCRLLAARNGDCLQCGWPAAPRQWRAL